MTDRTAPLAFIAEASDAGQRLDVVVAERLQRAGQVVSRSAVRQWIDGGRVLVGGVAGKASARIRVGARIQVEPAPPTPSHALPDASVSIVVLHQDDHILVIDKPAGVVVHPAKGHSSGTLVNGLLALACFEPYVMSDDEPEARQRPGIVHRLDKDTSGVMVVARSVVAREVLKEKFARHDMERVYDAVVVGRAEPATYDTRFGRHPTNRLRFSTRDVAASKRAVTHVRVEEVLAGARATRVSCRLETGRTHQIRVHLSECGHTPVLGDELYGGRTRDREIARIGKQMGRHWLHAAVLGFAHPVTGEAMRFVAELPGELGTALRALRDLDLDGRPALPG
ncbi:MAG: RluA family pseudouridine synthase [Polyangiaceae bacterium]|nr:RluA family pseudouridine synthase [Polyangiaceae bacterium]